MKTRILTIHLLVGSIALFAGARTVNAQSSNTATTTTQGDASVTVFNPTVDLKMEDGRIQISRFNLKAEGGYYNDQKKGEAARLRLRMGHPIYIFGDKDTYSGDLNTFGALKLNAGGSAEIDFNGDGVKKLDLESPSMALVAWNKKIFIDKDLQEAAKRRFGKGFGDLTASQRLAILESAQPTFTGSINLAEVSYRYLQDKALGAKESDVVLSAGNFDIHKAFKISGLNMDICAYARPIGVALGEVEIDGKKDKEPKFVSSFGGCFGTSLGPVGELKGVVDYRYLDKPKHQNGESKTNPDGTKTQIKPFIDYADLRMSELRVSAEINKLYGTPVGVGYEYNLVQAQFGGPDNVTHTEHRHWLKAKVAF